MGESSAPQGYPPPTVICIPLRGSSENKASTEREGFEPPRGLHPYTLSRRASSAAPAPLLFTLFSSLPFTQRIRREGSARLTARNPISDVRAAQRGHPLAHIIESSLRRSSGKRASTEREGFEPPMELPPYLLSRQAPSAARPSLLGRCASPIAYHIRLMTGADFSSRRPAKNSFNT